MKEWDILSWKKDEKGIAYCEFSSPFQRGISALRILEPNDYSNSSLLLFLPVESQLNSRYGDGIREALLQKLHQKHNYIIVAPTFKVVPWYFDLDDSKTVLQESHIVYCIIPMLNEIYSLHEKKAFLLGYSKSGFGALNILFHHWDLIGGISIWDPVLTVKQDVFKTLYSNDGVIDFENKYNLEKNIERLRVENKTSLKIALSGYDYFHDQIQSMHHLLKKSGIKHLYDNSSFYEHIWHGGWLPMAMEMLNKIRKKTEI